MDWKNARLDQLGRITADIHHPQLGWIPFTIDPNEERDDFDPAALDAAIRATGTAAPYVAPPVPDPKEADLTPAQFEWLLAYTGFDAIWDAAEAATKGKDQLTFATLRMERKRPRYRLSALLGLLESLAPLLAQIAPETDLSEAVIRAAWAAATEVR